MSGEPLTQSLRERLEAAGFHLEGSIPRTQKRSENRDNNIGRKPNATTSATNKKEKPDIMENVQQSGHDTSRSTPSNADAAAAGRKIEEMYSILKDQTSIKTEAIRMGAYAGATVLLGSAVYFGVRWATKPTAPPVVEVIGKK